MKMTRRTVLGLLGAGTLCAAAVAMSAGVDRQERGASPKSFSVHYEWRNGTVAPPYHYEYVIELGPGSRGRMVLTPGYPNPNGSSLSWTEIFAFPPASRERLYATMRAHGVFARTWAEASGPNRPVGGGSENLQVKANGRTFTIPGFVEGQADQADAQAVYVAINALVPAAARARLEAKQKKYQAQALKAQG